MNKRQFAIFLCFLVSSNFDFGNRNKTQFSCFFLHLCNNVFRYSLQVIHSNGILTGAFMNNGAVRCGSSVCRPVSNVFTKNPLPNGYVHIATIPIGASNISILELKNSENFLGKSEIQFNLINNSNYVQ